MPPKSKKTAKKAAKAASSKASTAVMSNWLAAGKKTADTNAMDESKEDVEDPIEDANEEAPPPVKRPKRGGARTSATKAVEQPPPESDSQMEGIEPLEDEYEAVDMNSQIDALQAKAAEPLEEGRTLRGGRNTLFRSISALDEGTTAYVPLSTLPLLSYTFFTLNELDTLTLCPGTACYTNTKETPSKTRTIC